MRIVRSRIWPGAGIVLATAFVTADFQATVIRVPQDHVLISQAVAAAKAGDVVEVDDGFYFEKNIVIDKPIRLRAKNAFGAAVYGSTESGSAIFIVRAACEIDGFILKNSATGVLQRDSPDVLWTGRNLALFNLREGISINDRELRRGSARLWDIIADGCAKPFETNDARLQVCRAFVANAEVVFSGSNHDAFTVRDVVAWNCGRMTLGDTITLDSGIQGFEASSGSAKNADLPRRLNQLFAPGGETAPLSNADRLRRESLLLVMMGDAFLQARNPRGAVSHFRSALEAVKSFPPGEAHWRALSGLAQANEAMGNRHETANFYRKAVAIIENVGLGMPDRTFQANFRKDKIGIYETLIGLLWDLHREDPSRGFDREAFEYAERSKARGFLSGLDLAGTGFDSPDWAARGPVLNRAVTQLQLALQDPDLPPARRSDLLRRLERVEDDRLAFLIGLHRRDLGSHRLFSSGLDDIRAKLLDPETVLLEYVLGESRSFAFLAGTDALRVVELPSEAELRPRIAKYLKFLTLSETGDFRGAAGSRILSEVLLAPFRERLSRNVKTLIVIPDGILNYLPFETLLRTTDGRDRFLIEDCEIAYGPSASALIRIADRSNPESFRMDFLGVANPFSLQAFGLSDADEIEFPRLSFGVGEIRTIRKYFPRHRTEALLGKEAREDRFKALPLADFRIIHIAAHGFFDDRNWQRSALVLLRDPAGDEDGFVQANDVFPLKLRADLLVLSGCDTGAGLLEKGEGLSGISSAFLAAGAKSVLLSLWSVNDKAASVFMAAFYRHFTAGRSKAEALRRAKLELLDSKYRHPFYWAPFVLQGR
jgi:CHAT domain-containing protein